MGLMFSQEETSESLLPASFLGHVTIQLEVCHVLNREMSPGALDFPEIGEIEVHCLSHPIYGTLLQQPELMKTVCVIST